MHWVIYRFHVSMFIQDCDNDYLRPQTKGVKEITKMKIAKLRKKYKC